MKIYQKAIIKTLAYAAVFQHPLTEAEIWRNLIWLAVKKPNFWHFRQTLEKLVAKKRIFKKQKFYYQLKNNSSWLKQRKKKTEIGRPKIAIAQKTAYFLSFLPTLKLIGLSGSLSLGLSQKEADIDLFFVCQKNTLWLTRLLVNLFLIFLDIKRKPNQRQVKDKICPNMFIEENHLKIPEKEQDLYSAYELSFLRVLWQKENYGQKLINANSWVKNYLPNAFVFVKVKKTSQKTNFFLAFLNNICQKLQLFYMKKRRTTEVIKKGYVRFHPNDARGWILPKYYQLIKQIEVK